LGIGFYRFSKPGTQQAPGQRRGSTRNQTYQETSTFFQSCTDFSVTVKNRVLLINKEMSLDKAPYRYDVRTDGERLLIDMLVLDKHGDIALQHTKEVTSSNYKTILDNLQSGVGFLFDD